MKIVSNDQSTILLESNNISKSIITISFPMMVTGFVDALYNIVDSIFVGRFVGEYALAALAVNSAIQIFLIAIGSLYGTGMTSIISRALGAKNDSKVKSTIVNGVFLCFISTFAISLLVLSNLDKVLTFMGSSEDVLSYSRQYGSIILWFGFLVPTNGVLHGILRARGAVKIVMKISMISAGTNIVLDALFIIVFGWGVKGAAIATIIAQMISTIFLFKNVSESYLVHFERHYIKQLRFPLVKEIYSIGITNFLKSSTFAIIGISANRALAPYGATAVAAFGVVTRILHMAYMPIFGSNLGTQALIGFNYGANRFIKVKDIIVKALRFALLLGLLPSLIFYIAPTWLFTLFTDSEEIIKYASTAIHIAGFTFALYGFQIFSSGALLAMGRPKQALFLTLARPIIMVLCVNTLPHYYETLGVWLMYPITDIIASIMTFIIITREIRILKKREELLRTIN